MRVGFKKKQLSVLVLLALMPGSLVYGACAPAGTANDDTITCDGTVDTQGVNAGAGNDSVTVSASAGTIRINATGTQTGVDAGDDADTVINWWMISAGSTTTQTQSPTPPSPSIGGLP